MNRVLITGATGAIGPRVCEAFTAAGYQVRAFVRSAPAPGVLPSGVEVMRGDLTDNASIDAALFGVDRIVHLAGLLHLRQHSRKVISDYERINVEATSRLADAAVSAHIKRLVLFSTIAVYKPSSGVAANEEGATCDDTPYSRSKLRAEQCVLSALRPDGVPLATVLRVAAVYGARVKGNYRQLIKALNGRRFVPIGPGTNRRTLIYDRDVARAAVVASESPAAAGRIFNVTDGQCHALSDIIAAICRALGRPQPRFSLPIAPVRGLARFADATMRLAGRPLRLLPIIDKYLEDVCVDGTRIRHELSFAPAFDLAAGWRDAIDEMRRSGALPIRESS